MSVRARVLTLVLAFLAVAAAVAFVVVHYLLAAPPAEDFAAGVTPDSGAQVSIVLQEDPQNTVTSTPDWVSYFIKSPNTGAWVHTTVFEVPAGTRVNVTILGYDGCTPLRNPYWGLVTGTIGNTANVDGKPVTAINSWSGCDVGHTFSIPGIGLNVPMASARPDGQPVQHLALHLGPAQDDDLQLHDAAARRGATSGSAGSRAAAASSTDLAVPCRPSGT